MARTTIYLPDDLAKRVRDSALNVSAVCQDAIEKALRQAAVAETADSELARVAVRLRATKDEEEADWMDAGFREGLDWAKNAASLTELEWLRGTCSWAMDDIDWNSAPESMREWVQDGIESCSFGMPEHQDRHLSAFSEGMRRGALELLRQVEPLI